MGGGENSKLSFSYVMLWKNRVDSNVWVILIKNNNVIMI